MSYELVVRVYNNGCEIRDNQDFIYYYRDKNKEEYRTNSVEALIRSLKEDLLREERLHE